MKIAFTYDYPKQGDAPLERPGMDPAELRAITWTPSILCTPQRVAQKKIANEYSNINWNLNISEIRVESRRAYEILCKIIPRSEPPDLFVRINPPQPIYKPSRPNLGDVSIMVDKENIELALATQILKAFPAGLIAKTRIESPVFPLSEVIVFPSITTKTSAHLARAVGQGYKIVSSDAGAAEEYLSTFARPGSWHVIHSWKAEHFIEAIKDLLGVPNRMVQTSYLDLTPWQPMESKK